MREYLRVHEDYADRLARNTKKSVTIEDRKFYSQKMEIRYQAFKERFMEELLEEYSIKKKSKPEPRKIKFTHYDMVFAEYMFSRIKENFPKSSNPSYDRWADIIRKLREDGNEGKEIRKVFDWTMSDDFWSKQIRSAVNLRKHYPVLHTKMMEENKPQLLKVPTASDTKAIDKFVTENKLPKASRQKDYFEYRAFLVKHVKDNQIFNQRG